MATKTIQSCPVRDVEPQTRSSAFSRATLLGLTGVLQNCDDQARAHVLPYVSRVTFTPNVRCVMHGRE